MRFVRSSRARLSALALAVVVVLLLVVVIGSRGPARVGWTMDSVRINGTREADGVPFILEGDLYTPDGGKRAPAVLMTHGWGGSKDTIKAQAQMLADRGFVVLAYSQRGFGGSGGKVHFDSPKYEVKDAQLMLDYLAKRPEVELDRAGDPRVGVIGESYAGGLALMLAGTDDRVDALVPSITWNDLPQALFPQFATTGEQTSPATLDPIAVPGVFKKQWTSLLLGGSASQPDPNQAVPAGPTPTPSATPSASPGAQNPQAAQGFELQTLLQACGRLDPQLCYGYIVAAQTGRPTKDMLKLLAASSPARVTKQIHAPTMLVQGQADSLFPLSEADASARQIASNGTSVQVVWTADGHDGGTDETTRVQALTALFLRHVLGTPPGDDLKDQDQKDAGLAASSLSDKEFSPWRVSVPDAVISTTELDPVSQQRSAASYPGVRFGGEEETGGEAPLSLTPYRLTGDEQLAVSPPGATPAAITTLPGASSALGLLSQAGAAASSSGGQSALSGGGSSGSSTSLSALPGQNAHFDTAPLTKPITITGSSRVSINLSSTAADATVFASLVDVAPNGSTTLPEQLVSPVRLDKVPAGGQRLAVVLPSIVHDVPAGHRLRVVISSTDQAYSLPSDARGYRISLAGADTLTVPQVPLRAENAGAARSLVRPAVILAVLIALLVLLFVIRGRRRRLQGVTTAEEEFADVPLAVRNLGKAYGDGFRAVTDLSFQVETGQVLGLLGPNGAGKTTTLRMLMGLIHPSEGEMLVFGHRITPGAPVLSRLGSFIEGPGFLPHLSGMENLELYWRATGRSWDDAELDLALDIAGLGDDVHRKVRTYSQGMRQRLAIAQAMLGLPDLLVLDEPTNGLDPPQIRAMRAVLQRYAQTGRTVIVSSHLLAEVEQTCTHLVVMSNGRLVAEGAVAEVIGVSNLTALDVSMPGRAASLATSVDGVSRIERTPTGISVHADADARGELVRTLVLAGVRVDRVAPQRGLEETFLALVGREDA